LAAFANGVSIHADDFDDTQLAVAKDRIYGLLTHPTVSVLPPAFAICEMSRRTGRDLLLAYHVGVEVETKIAEAISPRHYDEGFHTTGTCGSLGSGAACAKLRGLNALQTAYTLAIAAAQGGGFRDNPLSENLVGPGRSRLPACRSSRIRPDRCLIPRWVKCYG
jgi:2-methylcitrate dehydratase PrpD